MQIYIIKIYKHRSALETNSYEEYWVCQFFELTYCSLGQRSKLRNCGSPTQWSCIKDATRRRFWHSELALAWNVFDVSGSKNQHVSRRSSQTVETSSTFLWYWALPRVLTLWSVRVPKLPLLVLVGSKNQQLAKSEQLRCQFFELIQRKPITMTSLFASCWNIKDVSQPPMLPSSLEQLFESIALIQESLQAFSWSSVSFHSLTLWTNASTKTLDLRENFIRTLLSGMALLMRLSVAIAGRRTPLSQSPSLCQQEQKMRTSRSTQKVLSL